MSDAKENMPPLLYPNAERRTARLVLPFERDYRNALSRHSSRLRLARIRREGRQRARARHERHMALKALLLLVATTAMIIHLIAKDKARIAEPIVQPYPAGY